MLSSCIQLSLLTRLRINWNGINNSFFHVLLPLGNKRAALLRSHVVTVMGALVFERKLENYLSNRKDIISKNSSDLCWEQFNIFISTLFLQVTFFVNLKEEIQSHLKLKDEYSLYIFGFFQYIYFGIWQYVLKISGE